MSLYDFDEDPGWISRFLDWTTGLWTRWTAPPPDKIPYDRLVLKTFLELSLTRIRVVRRKQEAFNKEMLPEVRSLAETESPLAEPKARTLLDLERLLRVFDLLEPHLTLLLGSLDLPSHDMSPIPSVHAVLFAAPRVPRIEDLMKVRQQLLQKYGPVLAITKNDLVERELFEAIDTVVSRVDILKWLDESAPKKRWQRDLLEEIEQRNLTLAETSALQQDAQSSYPIELQDELLQLSQSAPPHHDDDDNNDDDNNDDNNNDGGFRDLLGHSNDSGPTDSPVAPLETSAFDFPDVPSSPPITLYPSLSLSDSLEQQLHHSRQSSTAH